MIHFPCPACNANLQVEDKHAGMKGDCIVCKYSFQAPQASTHTPDGKPLGASSTADTAGPAPMVGVGVNNVNQLIANFNKLLVILTGMNKQMGVMRTMMLDSNREFDMRLRDLTKLMVDRIEPFPKPKVSLQTDHPVAYETVDHISPRGTANDNTRWPRFVAACERHFQRPIKYLDLGCAGGGMVFEFLLRGHEAIGLEGSDLSQRTLRAEWRLIAEHLFTCDITKPFKLTQGKSKSYQADVITAWEVLEHIPKEQLPGMFENIRNHLSPDGIFVASVAKYDDFDETTGVHYHATIESRDWWEDCLWDNGLEMLEEQAIFSMHDYCRGIGARASDACYIETPWDRDSATTKAPGFHIVVKRLTPGKPKKVRPQPTVAPTIESDSTEAPTTDATSTQTPPAN